MMGADHFFPVVGGHEGAGVVVEVGPGVSLVQPGDHVSASFVPSCGRCRYCVSGRQNLCDYGAGTLVGGMITDGTPRHFTADGTPITMLAKLGTFSHHACVAENSLIKVDDDLPLGGRRARVVRRRHRLGFGHQPRRACARRHRGRRRHRRHRDQRRAGRGDGRRQAGDRRRPGRVQAGEGDGVRRHPHVRLDGGGDARRHRADDGARWPTR